MKLFLPVGLFILACLIPLPLWAQTTDSDSLSTNSATSTSASSSALQKARRITEEKSKQRSEKLHDKLIEKRQESAEKFKAQRDLFKQKLETIQSEEKKTLVEKIDTRISSINTEKTTHMSETLEKLRIALSRLSEKGVIAKNNGADTTKLEEAIVSASNTLQTAETAVVTQAGKEYIVSIQSETTLKTTVGVVIKRLQADLRATHQLVLNTKQALQTAHQELEKVNKQTRVATPSANTR